MNRLYIRPNTMIRYEGRPTTPESKLTEHHRYIKGHTQEDWLKDKHFRWASEKTLGNVAETRGLFFRSS